MKRPIPFPVIALAAAGALLLVAVVSSARAADPVVDSLHTVLAAKIGHLERHLDEKDFRSLAQSAGGAELLAQVLRARGDDQAWQAAGGRVVRAAKQVQEAASAASRPECRAAIQELKAACAAAAQTMPAGKPLSPPQPTLRPLMMLIDGVYADCKIAVMTGQPAEAKKGAYVIAELARLAGNLRGNNRTADQWTHLSGLLCEAALETARSPAEDAVEVRLLLRGVATRCDACHNAR